MSIANQKQVELLVKLGFIKALPEVLSSKNFRIMKSGLEALESILRSGLEAGNPVNQYKSVLEKEGMISLIEELQFHPDRRVYGAVARIIEIYF